MNLRYRAAGVVAVQWLGVRLRSIAAAVVVLVALLAAGGADGLLPGGGCTTFPSRTCPCATDAAWALRHVSFDMQPGELLGLCGRTGDAWVGITSSSELAVAVP